MYYILQLISSQVLQLLHKVTLELQPSLGLVFERYIVLIPSQIINYRFFHISVGALGTYSFRQAQDSRNLGYDVYLTTGIALPPLHGIGITLSYNHIDSLSLRLEYSGGIFLEKIE